MLNTYNLILLLLLLLPEIIYIYKEIQKEQVNHEREPTVNVRDKVGGCERTWDEICSKFQQGELFGQQVNPIPPRFISLLSHTQI